MKSKETNGDDEDILWNIDSTYAFGLYKRISSALGFWPVKNREASATQVGILSSIQLSLVVIFLKNAFTNGNCGTVTELVDALTLIICASMAIMKIIQPWRHQKRIQLIMNSALQDWSIVVDKKTRDIMMSYAYTGRMVLIIVMFGSYMTVIPLIMNGIPGILQTPWDAMENISFHRFIPVGPRCWVSATMSFHIYVMYYIFVSFHLLILVISYLGVDVFIFGIATHVCGQFELLYNSLENVNGNESFIQCCAIIRKFSKRHDHLLKIANLIEDTCNSIIFCEVAANTMLICISGIVLLTALKINDNGTVFSMILRLLVLYIQLFMYSYVGENLSNQAKKLRIAVYNCPWFEMSPRTVKDLQFIIMRCNYTFHLTAGKFYGMNLSNFKDLIKSMFSFFSLIRIMFEN